MINRLFITNYAIINRLEINFHKGLTTITGETGAGKSIILGALNLLLGNKFDSINFNDKSTKSIIEGEFNISRIDIKDFFAYHDLDYTDDIIVRREFLFEGKSRSFINDTPVKLDLLKKLGLFLVDIHSQHENLLLNNETFQIDLIDKFTSRINVDFSRKIKKYKNLFKKLQDITIEIESKKRLFSRADDITYQQKTIDEIDQLNLNTEEKEKIELEYNKMNNIHNIKGILSQIVSLFEEGDYSVMQNLNLIESKLSDLKEYDTDIGPIFTRVKQNTIDLNDILMELHTINHNLVFDGNKLELLKDRINAINSLEQKLHVFSVADILEKRDVMKKQINSFNNISKEIDALKSAKDTLISDLLELGNDLSLYRKRVLPDLTNLLENDLLTLGIKTPRVRFDINSTKELLPNGTDKVSLLFSSNKGYDLKPIVDIGSGGEIARLMLCIKKQLFAINQFATIIFDEIDSGVSGEIGRKMGRILQKISSNGQVICITHLPQIASLGNYHYQVIKVDGDVFSNTMIKDLSADDRVVEIARMLSGDQVNSEAVANAKKMLDIY